MYKCKFKITFNIFNALACGPSLIRFCTNDETISDKDIFLYTCGSSCDYRA